MNSVLFVLLAALAVSQVFSAPSEPNRPPSFWTPGVCARDEPSVANFDPARYAGLWYEVMRVDAISEKDLQCVTAQYGVINATHVTVTNYGFNTVTNKPETINGFAFVDPAGVRPKSHLTVQLARNVNGQVVFNEAPYHVWETDYTSYALVYACTPTVPGVFKFEIAWILGRTPTLDLALVNRLKAQLTSKFVDLSKFIDVYHNC